MSLKDLCSEYDTANAAVEEAKAALNTALQARSAVCESIAKEISPRKKFVRAGKEVTVVNREGNYFLRGTKSSEDLVSVD